MEKDGNSQIGNGMGELVDRLVTVAQHVRRLAKLSSSDQFEPVRARMQTERSDRPQSLGLASHDDTE